MKKPGPLVYLFGNPIALLVALGATAFFGYRWWSEGASPLPAIVAFLVFCQTMNATDQLMKYKEWKREWDAMAGEPRAPARKLTMQSPLVRILVGVPTWGVGFYWVMTLPNDGPEMLIAKACFWLGTALGVGSMLYQALPRRKKVANETPAEYPDVAVCLPVPRSSPSVRDVLSNLPDSCRSLLSR